VKDRRFVQTSAPVGRQGVKLCWVGWTFTPTLSRPGHAGPFSQHRLQWILGEHQDSVVSRSVARRLGVQAQLEGDDALTLGLLHGLEQGRGRCRRTLLGSLAETGRKIRRVLS